MISISKTVRVLIIGGSGLIGRALALNLARDGEEYRPGGEKLTGRLEKIGRF